MNRSYLIVSVFLFFSCTGHYRSNAPMATINTESNKPLMIHADTIHIDVLKSSINWIATEMRGLKKRTGKISFKTGYLLSSKHQMIGGNFLVDMETIDVTDIPAHEVIARKNLIAHLKNEDFFNTDQYPTAHLAITQIEALKNDELKINGDLTIRGITQNITFLARQQGNRMTTKFTFNRLDWKVAYTGSWADKTLVDNDIELAIEVVTK